MKATKTLLAQREKELNTLKEKEQLLENQIEELTDKRDELEFRLVDGALSLEERDVLISEIDDLSETLKDLKDTLKDVILVEIESLEEEIQNLKRELKQ